MRWSFRRGSSHPQDLAALKPAHLPAPAMARPTTQVCLYCDAFEYTGHPMGAYGNGERGVHIAFEVGAGRAAGPAGVQAGRLSPAAQPNMRACE